MSQKISEKTNDLAKVREMNACLSKKLRQTLFCYILVNYSDIRNRQRVPIWKIFKNNCAVSSRLFCTLYLSNKKSQFWQTVQTNLSQFVVNGELCNFSNFIINFEEFLSTIYLKFPFNAICRLCTNFRQIDCFKWAESAYHSETSIITLVFFFLVFLFILLSLLT